MEIGRGGRGSGGKDGEKGGQDDGRAGRWKGRKDEGGKDEERNKGRAGKDEGWKGRKGRGKDKGKGADFCGIILKELFLTLHTTKVVGFLLQPLLRS